MYYSLKMIEELGYTNISDFVLMMVEMCRYGCSIQYTGNGVYIYYDFDSVAGLKNN